MVDTTKTTAHAIGHMTYVQVPVACGKSIFLLLVFHFTYPVKSHPTNTPVFYTMLIGQKRMLTAADHCSD